MHSFSLSVENIVARNMKTSTITQVKYIYFSVSYMTLLTFCVNIIENRNKPYGVSNIPIEISLVKLYRVWCRIYLLKTKYGECWGLGK